MVPSRPLLRYFGGKWRLAPWIVSHFPAHDVYTEAFGGAASVLLRKPRSYAEVYNDADGEVVNLFRMARDRGEELVRAVGLTPFARDEFDLAHVPAPGDPLESARRLVVRSFMGFGADSVHSRYKSGFRANSNKSGSTPAHDWERYPDGLRALVERLRGVVVENRDWSDTIAQHDAPTTLHYCDPPYTHGTRSRPDVHGYRHEMSDGEHRELLWFLRERVRGAVVVSGYANDLYDGELEGWSRVDCPAMADGARPRTESLWLNPAACRAVRGPSDPFGLQP